MTVLRDRAVVITSSDEDLLETYRAMTGKLDHPGFSSRAALEVQASMAMLAGQYAAEQLGVPKDSLGGKTIPMTLAEVSARVAQRSSGVQGARTVAVDQSSRTRTSIEMAKEKAPKPEGETRGRKKVNATYKLTGEGTTTVRPSSARGQLLAHLSELPGKKSTTEELNAVFGRNCQGDLRVLVRLGHLAELA